MKKLSYAQSVKGFVPGTVAGHRVVEWCNGRILFLEISDFNRKIKHDDEHVENAYGKRTGCTQIFDNRGKPIIIS